MLSITSDMAEQATEQNTQTTQSREAKLPSRPAQKDFTLSWSGARIDEAKFLEIAGKGTDRAALVSAMREAGIHVIFLKPSGENRLQPIEQLNDPKDTEAAKFYAENAAEKLKTGKHHAHTLLPGEYRDVDAVENGKKRPLSDRPVVILTEALGRDETLHELVHALTETGPLQKLGSLDVDSTTVAIVDNARLRSKNAELFADVEIGGKRKLTNEEGKVLSKYYQNELNIILSNQEYDVGRFLERHSKQLKLSEELINESAFYAVTAVIPMLHTLIKLKEILPHLQPEEQKNLNTPFAKVNGLLDNLNTWNSRRNP
jgi:hypothetical protein